MAGAVVDLAAAPVFSYFTRRDGKPGEGDEMERKNEHGFIGKHYLMKQAFGQEELHEREAVCTREDPPPCMASCPLYIDMRAVCAHVAKGDFKKAAGVIRTVRWRAGCQNWGMESVFRHWRGPVRGTGAPARSTASCCRRKARRRPYSGTICLRWRAAGNWGRRVMRFTGILPVLP